MNKDPSGNARYRRWYAVHREDINQQRRMEYESRRAAGLCPRCAASTGDGGLCADCLASARAQQNKKRNQDEDPPV